MGIKQYAAAAGGAEQGGVSEVVVIAASVACGSVALLAVVLGAYKWRAGRPARVYRRPPDPDSPDTSFASTDIQCSTELWEMFPDGEMDLAVKMHNSLLKSVRRRRRGGGGSRADALIAVDQEVPRVPELHRGGLGYSFSTIFFEG